MKTLDLRLNYSAEPNLLLTHAGVIQLKTNVLKSRATGSKNYVLDRDGKILQKEYKQTEIKKTKQVQQKKYYRINKTEVRNKLQSWITSQRYNKKLFFITISFPIEIQNNFKKTILNSYLTTLRQSYELKNYLWIMERQKNGSYHFHIAVDVYINITKANEVMKNLLHYYIRKKKITITHMQAKKYNGVDIAKNRKNRRVTNFAVKGKTKILSHYLTKYITKSEEKFPEQAWQASRTIANLFTKYCMTETEFYDIFLEYIDLNECLIQTEFFNFFRWAKSPPIVFLNTIQKINENILFAAPAASPCLA
jgi:hypothetical protein